MFFLMNFHKAKFMADLIFLTKSISFHLNKNNMYLSHMLTIWERNAVPWLIKA